MIIEAALISSLISLDAADTVFVTVTFDELISWFKDCGTIVTSNKDIIAFTVAQRINGKDYTAAPGIFPGSHRTQIIQGLYNRKTTAVIEQRLIKSNRVTAADVVKMHDDGAGFVVYTLYSVTNCWASSCNAQATGQDERNR